MNGPQNLTRRPPLTLMTFKGTVSRDFWNGTPGGPDSWTKAVLNLYSISRRNSIRFDAKNRLCAIYLPLCGIARSRDSTLCGIGRSRLRTMPHRAELSGIARSQHLRKFLCEFATICKNILTRWSVTQVGMIHEKNQWSKISWDCHFKLWSLYCTWSKVGGFTNIKIEPAAI
jgi:hypothetical protein